MIISRRDYSIEVHNKVVCKSRIECVSCFVLLSLTDWVPAMIVRVITMDVSDVVCDQRQSVDRVMLKQPLQCRVVRRSLSI